MAEKFHLLSYGLAAVLIFIGGKMLIVDFLQDPGRSCRWAWSRP